jgi:hypothetical protein
MNPILLQLKKGMAARVIVMGRPLGEMGAWEYRDSYFLRGLEVIKKALGKLRRENEILVIEGAGSPVEVNLKEKDLANMKVASLADSPVILIADIDRGGAFAALIGTLELLEPKERASLLNIEHLKTPFSYRLRVNFDEIGEPEEAAVDIPETFNYLLGLSVKKLKYRKSEGRKYVFILGEKDSRDIAVVWRNYEEDWDKKTFKKDKDFIEENILPSISQRTLFGTSTPCKSL